MKTAMPNPTSPEVHLPGLSDALQRLSTQPQVLAQERARIPADPRARLEFLLQEIDEIVLPRVLRIEANGREVARFSVANRRLASVPNRRSSRRHLSDPHAEIDEIAMTLLEASKTATSIRVQPSQSDDAFPDVAASFPVTALRTALGLDEQGSALDQLAQLLDPIAAARLVWTGDAVNAALSGEEIWHRQMQACARQVSEKNANKRHQSEPVGTAVLITDSEILILMCESNKGVCWVTTIAQGLKAIGNWQTIARQSGSGTADAL